MKERAKIFWEWFSENSAAYLFMNEVDERLKSRLLQDLKQHLFDYCDKLCFEIGGDPNGDQELIVTAEGNPEYFEYAEFLIATSPNLDNWQFYALIPPRGTDFEISIEDTTLRVKNMWFQPMGYPGFPEVTGVRVGIPNYEEIKDKSWLQPVVAKVIEYILGEKAFALNMHHVEVSELPEAPAEWGMFPLPKLEKFMKWKQHRALELIRAN